MKYISDVWFDHYEPYQDELGEDAERLERRISREPFTLSKGSNYYSPYEKCNATNLDEEINSALAAIEEANKMMDDRRKNLLFVLGLIGRIFVELRAGRPT